MLIYESIELVHDMLLSEGWREENIFLVIKAAEILNHGI